MKKRNTTINSPAMRARHSPPAQETIAARAYEIYLERGCQHGHDVDDWLQAEYELRRLPVRKLASLVPRECVPAVAARQHSLLDVVRLALW